MYMAHSQYPGNPIAHTKSKKKTGGAPLDRGPTGGDRLVGISGDAQNAVVVRTPQ